MATDERSATDPRPMRADARRNRGRVLAAAREAFTEHGIDATMDDIARRAAVGPGTLYRHFPTREALLAAVYRGDVDALAAQARELALERPPEEALHAWLRLQLDYIHYKRGLGTAVKTILGADSAMLTDCRDIMRAALGRLLAGAQEVGAVRADIEAAELLRLVHGVVLASETAPDQAERLLSIVLDGLRPQRG
jgi:AcrR family transcriptional regulator